MEYMEYIDYISDKNITLQLKQPVTMLLGNNSNDKKMLLECIYNSRCKVDPERKIYRYDPNTIYPPSSNNELIENVYKEVISPKLGSYIIEELNEIKTILPSLNIHNYLSSLINENNILVLLDESDFPLSDATSYVVGREIAYLSKRNNIYFVISVNTYNLYIALKNHAAGVQRFYVKRDGEKILIKELERSWYIPSISLGAVLR